jgi:hypothetical protein
MPPRRRPPSARLQGGIEKKTYMTNDEAKRLRLAKKAARVVLRSGGSTEAAAAAAQAYGTPCDDNSEASDSGADEEQQIAEESLPDAIAEQLQLGSMLDVSDPAAGSARGSGSAEGQHEQAQVATAAQQLHEGGTGLRDSQLPVSGHG